jgi:PAS domain S-box-containing protein
MISSSSRQVHAVPKMGKESFQSEFGHLPIGTCLIDVDDHFIWANHAFSAMLGYSQRQILKMDFFQITHAQDRELNTRYKKRLQTGSDEYISFQERFIHKDGHVMWVAVTVSAIRYTDSKSLCFLNFVQDMTNGILTASELRNRRLFESARDGIVILDASSGRIIDVNPALEELCEYSREYLLGQRLVDIGLFPDAESCENVMGALQKQGSARYEQLTLRSKSGSPRDVELVGSAFQVDGRTAIQCNIRDLGASRVSEALLESEERFRVTFDQVAVGIAQIAPDGRLVRINQKYCDIVGYTAEELLQHGLQAITHPDDLALDYRYIRRALCGEIKSYSIDKRYRRKNGTLFWVNVTNNLIAGPSGEPKYFISVVQDISVFQDITHRKHLQEELLQARKMEAIGRLAGGIAHDFNNLLTVITGYCGIILPRLQEQNPLRHEIVEIKTAGERAAALTAKLLAFSRRQVAQRKVINLNTVMGEIQGLLRRLLGEDIEFAVHVEPGLGLVEADEGQIGQVIMNLAVNARDAMPTGGNLSIKLSNVNLDAEYARKHVGIQAGRYVMLSVSDTGCGMDAETQARIFDPFFTTKQEGKGTGLGLSTVYGIVKEHDGHVDVDSVVGVGTTMRVYLPRVEGPAEANATVPGQPQRTAGTETILLVEDDDQLRHMVAEILHLAGYTVLEAENGLKALQLAQGQVRPIHLMLTDVVMSGMNGCALAEKMMSSRSCNAVLFMSGYTGDANALRDAVPREAPILIKPFTPEQLLLKIRSVLDRDGPN